MHARGPPRNVSILPQTPGIEVAASGTDDQRSGLRKRQTTETAPISNIVLPEFICVISPNLFASIKVKNWDHNHLASLNSTGSDEKVSSCAKGNRRHSQNRIVDFAIDISDRFCERKDVVFNGNSDGAGYWGVKAKSFSDEEVEIGKRIQFVHCRVVSCYSHQFLP